MKLRLVRGLKETTNQFFDIMLLSSILIGFEMLVMSLKLPDFYIILALLIYAILYLASYIKIE
jgi:hypothetical protein